MAFGEMNVDFFPKKEDGDSFSPRSFSISEESPPPSQIHQQQIPSDYKNVIFKDKRYEPILLCNSLF